MLAALATPALAEPPVPVLLEAAPAVIASPQVAPPASGPAEPAPSVRLSPPEPGKTAFTSTAPRPQAARPGEARAEPKAQAKAEPGRAAAPARPSCDTLTCSRFMTLGVDY